MNQNFYNVASNFWRKSLASCTSCSNREKSNLPLSEMPLIKSKKETLEENLNTSSNLNNQSQISFDSNENPSSDLTNFSFPIKFSGNPKGKSWSTYEDDLLKDAVQLYYGKNWKLIASKVPSRSSTQCSQRWRRIQPYKNRFPWNSEEDMALDEFVKKYGQNWSIIASFLHGRTGKQVRERYLNNLDPNINRNRFTREEDEKIIELYTTLGPKWKEISKDFLGRTENMIKNRFYSHIKKKLLLKYPQKYIKALEKAQTESSVNNFTSIKKDLKRSLSKRSEKLSSKDDFSEFESNFQQTLNDLEYQKMEFINQENIDFKADSNEITNINQNNGFGEGMDIEDNIKINDGFLDLYRSTKEIQTPTKNEFYKSIYSPLHIDIPYENHLINDSNHNCDKNDGFTLKNEDLHHQKYENELIESKNAIVNSFFNVKEDFLGKIKSKREGEFDNNNDFNENCNEKLMSQMNYLNTKKTRLETMIKEIMGKIDQSNSQNL